MTGGTYGIAKDRTIVLFGEAAQHGTFGASRLQAALAKYADAAWEIRAASGLAEREGVVAAIDHQVEKREGYHLTIGDERIGIVARDAAGLAHGFATLTQIVRQYGRRLPQLHIEDHPDFAHRGVMLDISRDKVPTMATLYGLVDMLAEWKVNQFQLYMEHTFAYEQHRAVWKDASPMTGEEVLALDAYCRERYIELVPNQNSFGHMERWLDEEAVQRPRGVPARSDACAWGASCRRSRSTRSTRGRCALIDGLYAELLPHFSSRQLQRRLRRDVRPGAGARARRCARSAARAASTSTSC